MAPMSEPSRSPRFFWFYLLGIVLVFAALRWPMLDVPMERDEGEYATIGLGIYHGIPPYQEAYTMKLPGAASLHALIFKCLGPSVRSIHLALLAINAVTILLVALVGRKLIAPSAGLLAGAAYGTFTIGTGLFGYWLSAEHFAAFFLMAGALCVLAGLERHQIGLFIGAFLLGCSVVVKHHAAAPALAWLLIAAWKVYRSDDIGEGRSGKLAWVASLGVFFLAPVAITIAIMSACGVFEAFQFWTWRYARMYITGVSWSIGWEYLKVGLRAVIPDAPLLWILSVVGAGVLLVRPSHLPWSRTAAPWLLLVFLASVVSVSAGLMFRGQYFILLAPAAALLAGVAWEALVEGRFLAGTSARKALYAAFLVAAFAPLAGPLLLNLRKTPDQVCRLVYGMHPFPECPSVATYLRQHTRPDEKIAVLGSEPEIYFLADRRPALPYLCAYEMMKPHTYASFMQREAIRCIEQVRPKYIVDPEYPTSWGIFPGTDPTFRQWLRGFIQRHYQLDGIVDLITEDRTAVLWGNAARAYQPDKSSIQMYIYVRQEPPPITPKIAPPKRPEPPKAKAPVKTSTPPASRKKK
jgi:hypothetical protein